VGSQGYGTLLCLGHETRFGAKAAPRYVRAVVTCGTGMDSRVLILDVTLAQNEQGNATVE